MSKRRPHLLAVALLAVPAAASGCGADDHPNEPRPAPPIEVTARVDAKHVTIAPDQFGAGLVNLTISNQSDDTVALTVEEIGAVSDPIPPNAVGNFKVDFAEEGIYDVSAGSGSNAKPGTVTVGPARPSGQNQVLLP
jgi:hypothetical protein